MLTISKQRLTGSQITVTEAIRDAALAQTGVTENEWNNFNSYAAWRNPYYIVYRDYQTALSTFLLTGLENYYKMEGNSNDSLGGLNGTDNAITYGLAEGKINQGASVSSVAGYIEIGSTSSFNFIHQTGIFGINLWYKQSSLSGTYRLMASTNNPAQKGFYLQVSNNSTFIFVINNGSGDAFNCAYVTLARSAWSTAYQMITVTGDGTYFYIYVDGQQVARAKIGPLTTGNAQNALRLFYLPGSSGSSNMFMDEVGFWSRVLTPADVLALYNNGAGITYPF